MNITTPKNNMPRWFIVLAIFCLVFVSSEISAADPFIQRPLRVGVWVNQPLAYETSQGDINGLFPALFTYVVKREGWDLQYEKGVFPELMTKFEKGDIDLLFSVSTTEER